MPSKFAFAVALAVVVAHDIKTQIEAQKAAKLFLTAHEQFREIKTYNHAQIEYLINMLIENGIELDEFDLIALNFDTTESK